MGGKREALQKRKKEGEILEIGHWRGSGIRAAMGVVVGMVVLHENWKVVAGAGTARLLEEEGKQKRLHRRFRHLPRGRVLVSR